MKHFGSTSGLTALVEDQATPANGMAAYITSSYNSGYQNGDIKGAFLSDTDETDLVGAELVTNGTFDSDVSGWTATDGAFTFASGEGLLTSDGSSQYAYANASTVSVVVGKTYVFSGTYRSGTANGVRLTLSGATSRNIGADNAYATAKTLTISFVAQTTSLYIQGIVYSADSTSRTGYFDNISIKLADADRSVNNNGLIVNGTVTRTPVATGADLVAYSGFSASNYLEQPYNSALDFGTGDFCFMWWTKGTDANAHFFDRDDLSSAGGRIRSYCGSGTWSFNTGTALTVSESVQDGTWKHLCAVRESGVLTLYVNGSAVGSAANTNDVTNTSAVFWVGLNIGGSAALDLGSLSLFRISATAPTAEQIAKIYEDEKVLFEENAACTLYGTSDAVTALSHDPDTDLLHVGTSAGRSVFRGLERIQNTTTSVSKAISAAGGLIAEK